MKAEDVPGAEQLRQREEQLANGEIELALRDARVRGREGRLATQRDALNERASWIEEQVSSLRKWSGAQHLEDDELRDVLEILRGLGDGAAHEEADLDGYVARSETLMVARVAMAAQRAEVLQRRQTQLDERAREVSALEEAIVRADVRIAARERMLIEAIQKIEQVAGGSEPAKSNGPTATKRRAHTRTVTMSDEEAARADAEVAKLLNTKRRVNSAPPILDIGFDEPAKPGKSAKK